MSALNWSQQICKILVTLGVGGGDGGSGTEQEMKAGEPKDGENEEESSGGESEMRAGSGREFD